MRVVEGYACQGYRGYYAGELYHVERSRRRGRPVVARTRVQLRGVEQFAALVRGSDGRVAESGVLLGGLRRLMGGKYPTTGEVVALGIERICGLEDHKGVRTRENSGRHEVAFRAYWLAAEADVPQEATILSVMPHGIGRVAVRTGGSESNQPLVTLLAAREEVPPEGVGGYVIPVGANGVSVSPKQRVYAVVPTGDDGAISRHVHVYSPGA